MVEDLAADEDQHQRQCVLEVYEPVHQRRQRKVQRAQAKNGKDVRGVDNERVLGDGEDRGYAVHCEHQVGQLDQHQCQEQRRCMAQGLVLPRGCLADKEVRAMDLVGHPQVPAHELEDWIVGQVWMAVFFGQRHLHPGEQQEGPEEVQHPGEVLHQCCAHPDHDRAQDHHPEDAPEQHAVLVTAGDGEIAENHGHDEHVVHRQ